MLPPDGVISAYSSKLRGHFIRFQEELMRAVNAELARRGARTDSTEAFLDHLRRLGQRWNLEDMSAPTHEAAEATAKKNAREFKKVFGLKVRGLEPGITERINRFRTENVSKIKSLQGDQLTEIRNLLDTGLEEGKHANTLRGEIQERFKVTRSKADLLARDQVLKLNGAITKDRQTRAGVKRYRWITSRDERTRGNPSGLYPVKNGSGDHWHLHGKTFSWDSPPVVEARTGRTAHPGEDYQCRCVAVPEIEELSAEDEALFESATGSPAGQSEVPAQPQAPIIPVRTIPVPQPTSRPGDLQRVRTRKATLTAEKAADPLTQKPKKRNTRVQGANYVTHISDGLKTKCGRLSLKVNCIGMGEPHDLASCLKCRAIAGLE